MAIENARKREMVETLIYEEVLGPDRFSALGIGVYDITKGDTWQGVLIQSRYIAKWWKEEDHGPSKITGDEIAHIDQYIKRVLCMQVAFVYKPTTKTDTIVLKPIEGGCDEAKKKYPFTSGKNNRKMLEAYEELEDDKK